MMLGKKNTFKYQKMSISIVGDTHFLESWSVINTENKTLKNSWYYIEVLTQLS